MDLEARRLLRRIERKLPLLSHPSSEEAAHAAMRLGMIFDCRRNCIVSRLSAHKAWENVCSICAERFADMLIEGTDEGKLCACEAIAALTQVSEISRSIAISQDKIFRGLLHCVCTMNMNERKLPFATLSSISLHCEEGSFAIIACPNTLSTFSRLLAAGDDESKKDASDLLNNCAYFSERAAQRIAGMDGIVTSLLEMCQRDTQLRWIRGSAVGALNSLSIYPAVAPHLAAAGTVEVVAALRDLQWPVPSQIDTGETVPALEDVRGSAAEAQMVLANLSVHCDVGDTIICSEPVLQSIVHFACCAVAGRYTDALFGEALWLTKGCLLPLARLLRCEANLACLARLESAGGEGGTWLPGHVSRSIVRQLLQNWLEQIQQGPKATQDEFPGGLEGVTPVWMWKSFRVSSEDVALALALLDALVCPQSGALVTCNENVHGHHCHSRHFLTVIRHDDESMRSSCPDSQAGAPNLERCHDCAGPKSPPLSILLRTLSMSSPLHTEDVSKDAVWDMRSGVMWPRLLALAMAHHPRIGEGDPSAGRHCWLRDVDANVLAMIARQACSVAAYAAALSEWIFPEPHVCIARVDTTVESRHAGLLRADIVEGFAKLDTLRRGCMSTSASRSAEDSAMPGCSDCGSAEVAGGRICGKRRR